MRAYLLFIPLFLISILSYSQTRKDSLVTNYLSQARKQISEENYIGANTTLKKIFSLKTTVPDEVAFRYGQVQWGIGDFIKSKEALEKYLALTDSNGAYVQEAKKLLSEVDLKICPFCTNSGWRTLIDTCDICKGRGKVETPCADCSGRGIEYCQVCKGKGVVYKTGSFGGVYQSCTNCNGKGISSCSHCNGTGKREKYCDKCKGKGLIKRSVICNHR